LSGGARCVGCGPARRLWQLVEDLVLEHRRIRRNRDHRHRNHRRYGRHDHRRQRPARRWPERGGLAKPSVVKAAVTTPALKRAFTKFATCMRESGVNFPLPNTSGKGPIFSAKGVDIRSAKFKAAELKCRGDLLNAFRAQRGASKVGTTGATSGSTGQTKASPAPKLKVKVPPKVTHALQQFTTCMREHGVTSYPEPEGASFNLSHTHVDTKSAQYKAAETKCNPILNAAF